jgi:hypothetical protein
MFADDYTYQQSSSSRQTTSPNSRTTHTYHNVNDNDNSPLPPEEEEEEPSSSSSWKSFKKEGTNHYHNSNYEQALLCFQQAFQNLKHQTTQNNNNDDNDIPIPMDFKRECAILLSNSVVCRLQIGGTEMIIVAVEEAKQVSYKNVFIYTILQFVTLVVIVQQVQREKTYLHNH